MKAINISELRNQIYKKKDNLAKKIVKKNKLNLFSKFLHSKGASTM